MNRKRVATIPERIVMWFLGGVSVAHPALLYLDDPDIREYWNNLPRKQRTATTALLVGLYPVVEYGTLVAPWVAVFVGSFWKFALVVVAARWLRGVFKRYYNITLAQPTSRYEREYPELFADHDVTIRIRDVSGESAAILMRLWWRDYLLVDPEMLRSRAPVEVEATLAHELGHSALDHLRWKAVLSWLAWTPVMAMFWVVIHNLGIWMVVGLLALMLSVRLVREWISRRMEYAADAYAVKILDDPFAVSRWLWRLQFSDFRGEGMFGWLRILFSTHPRTTARRDRVRVNESGETGD